MIRFCSDIKASANTSVTSVYGFISYRQNFTFTLSAPGITNSARGAGIFLSTLSRLNGNKPLTAKPALIFFSVNAFSLIRLYKKVKCFLPIVFIFFYSSRLT